ncbi:MAG: phytoene/squalene synthase family protein, partial [Myxococcota bacterium]
EERDMDIMYALELIEGVESDLGTVVFESDRELLRYCYRVAGTVGLMMCAVLGVDEQEALPHAIDLGVAMQITNICRDVLEDAQRGRVYLPADRLRAAGTSSKAVLDGDADRDAVARVVDDLLELANSYYASADDGMRYIPARCRLAIVVASRVYRAIGVKLRSNGSDALAGRTIVGWAGKTWWVWLSLFAYTSPRISGLGSYREHDAELHEALRGLPGVMAA